MKKEKVLRKLALALDGLLILLFLFIVGNTFNMTLVYLEGANLLEYAFEFLTYMILIRVALVIPWKSLPKVSFRRGVFLAGSGVMFVLFLFTLINTNFYSAVQAIMITRVSFEGATDQEIARDITKNNLWYPPATLVEHIKEEVPEDGGIAYFGDQRAHIMSYLLYPRRVYALPEMQIVLNEMIEENWTWSPLIDPFHPPKDPLNPVFEGYPQNQPNEELQQDFLKMVEDRNIEWVLYYDSTHPAKSWLRRIEG